MGNQVEQQDQKKEKILEAAYQQFLHYGYSKTTMNEIAGALSLSKALLYYYFPDKSSLYVAVTKKLAEGYLESLENKLSGAVDLREAFVSQINIHHDFIVANYNFFDFIRLKEQSLPDGIWAIIDHIRKEEMKLLGDAIKTAVAGGEIKAADDPGELVDLLLDALHGVRVGATGYKKSSFPRKEHLDEIHRKRLLLVDIFIKGLKY